MKCPACNEEIRGEPKFCPHCGKVKQPAAANQTEWDTISLPEAEVEFEKVNEEVNAKKEKKSKKSKRKQRGKPSRLKKFTAYVITSAILAILLFVSYSVIALISPELRAKRFFAKVASNDFSGMYDDFELPKNPLLTKEIFIRLQEKKEERKIQNWKLDAVSDVNLPFPDLVLEYDVKYTLAGETKSESEIIRLLKLNRKKIFVLPAYAVAADRYLIEDFTVHAPCGTVLAIEGIPADSWKTGEADGMDIYSFPLLFTGTWQLEASHPASGSNTANAAAGVDSGAYTLQMPFTEEIKADLAKKTEDFMRASAGCIREERAGIAAVNVPVTKNEGAAIELDNAYMSYFTSLTSDRDTLEFTEFINESSAGQENRDATYTVKMKGITNFDLLFSKRSFNMALTWMYEDGEWVLLKFETYGFF